MNYLNQFGQLIPGNYKDYDPVSELYYAALRYYRNLGNVSAWSAMGGTNAQHQEDLDRWFSCRHELGRPDPVFVPAKFHPGDR